MRENVVKATFGALHLFFARGSERMIAGLHASHLEWTRFDEGRAREA